MKARLKFTVADWFVMGACVAYAGMAQATYWVSWRRVERELRRLKVGQP